MDRLTPFEVFVQAFFDRWPDYPPSEVEAKWEADLRPAFDKAVAALLSDQEGKLVEAARLAVSKLDEAQSEETVYGDDFEALADEARSFLVAALSSTPDQDEEACERCGGSGDEWVQTAVDDFEVTGDCPDCHGTGKKTAPQQDGEVVVRLRRHQIEQHYLPQLDRLPDNMPLLSKPQRYALRDLLDRLRAALNQSEGA